MLANRDREKEGEMVCVMRTMVKLKRWDWSTFILAHLIEIESEQSVSDSEINGCVIVRVLAR